MNPVSSALPAGLAALLLVTLLTGTLHQRLSPSPLPHTLPPLTPLQARIDTAGFPLLSLAETQTRHHAGSHLFLDARPLADHLRGHIPGSFPVPVSDFDTHFPDVAPILLPDAPLIVYCSNAACDQALRLAERLREAGFTAVSIFSGGFDTWTPETAP